MTPDIIAKATGARIGLATVFCAPLTDAMARCDISTPLRQAAFLANVGHESGGLQWTVELWGPTEAQRRYEHRADLGNRQSGDGYRYRGRGLLQTTGRFNYRALTRRLRTLDPTSPDFEEHPELLSDPKWASVSAADFWAMHRKLNALADRGAFVDIVRCINGGTTGLEERWRLYSHALEALSVPT